MPSMRVTRSVLLTALGRGRGATQAALDAGRGGLRPCDLDGVDIDTFIGRVAGIEKAALPAPLARYECRNNRLAAMALQTDGFADSVRACASRVGAARVGVFVGTSTSGLAETEFAYATRDAAGALPSSYRYRETHNTFSVVDFMRRYLGLSGVGLSVSTACSSSLKVFASARRHLRAGLCDAAIVGGVDTLCLTTLYGFRSLQLVSPEPCRPWDAGRCGISVGEAAGFALIEAGDAQPGELRVLGCGESVDAHHMSAPHPQGLGAQIAMRAALDDAGLSPDAIDYVCLHGTATPANDLAEDQAMVEVFGTATPCSSVKGWTGHTLGAAGIASVLITDAALRGGYLPRSLNTQQKDPVLRANVVMDSRAAGGRRWLTNAFGFGGNNSAVISEIVTGSVAGGHGG